MDTSTLWRLILIGVVALILLSVAGWLIGFLKSLIGTAITIAIVVGVIWLLFNLLSKKSTY